MEALLKSSSPDSLYAPLKDGAILPEDYEDLQTISRFVKCCTRYRISSRRRTLHVYYIGQMSSKFLQLSQRLMELLTAFFCLPVVVKGHLVAEPTEKANKYIVHPVDSVVGYHVKVQKRKRGPGRMVISPSKTVTELDAGDLLTVLRQYIESDTYTVLGITSHNIYNPAYKDDIIMGLGCGSRSCVISIPECFDTRIKNKKAMEKAAFFEMAKTAIHELSHTFGIDHCVEYHCIMNSQYVKEDPERNPLYFCPICICKLQVVVGFDCKQRWEDLKKFYIKTQMKASAKWISKRIKLWDKDVNK